MVIGILGSFGAALIASKAVAFWEKWSRLLLILLGFGTVCLVRVDPYAVICFALFTLVIIHCNAHRINSGSDDSSISDLQGRAVSGSAHLCFKGVLTLSLFWFFLHGIFSATANIWSLKTWYLIFAHRSPVIFPVYGQLASLALFCGYLSLFSASASARSIFLRGLHAGLWFAVPLVLAQLVGVELPYVPGEAPFWQYLNRHSGMFEDPNSFGVVSGLVVFIGGQQGWYLLSFLWVLIAFFSGSRLFTLSLVILLVVFLMRSGHYAETKWKIARSDLLLRGIALLSVILILGVTAYLFLAQSYSLPSAIHRGLSPLNIRHLQETFSTRTAFWSLGLQIFADNSLAGVGFGNFERIMTSYARRSGNDLNLWTDTPNNFYFGLLSELGIIGFMIFIFELRKLSWNKSEEPGIFLRAGVFVFLLTLFFGTHIYFIEFALIGAFVVGSCVTEKRVEKYSFMLVFQILRGVVIVGVVALLLALHRSMEYGWYPWERDIDGSYARWGAPRAQLLQKCKDDRVEFEIALPPERTVEIRSPFAVRTLKTLPSSWQEVSMECNGAARLPLTFVVSKGWIPAVDSPETNEWRTLGVRLKGDPGDMAAPLGIG